MKEYYDELHDLHSGQVFLPPKVLLHVRTERGQHVVHVHEDVYEGVDDAEKSRVSTGEELYADPAADRHHRVMVQMQERNLPVLFAQHEEHRVQQFDQFAYEIHVNGTGHLQFGVWSIIIMEESSGTR